MPVGPPLSLSAVFCFSQTHSCLFCCPPASVLVRGTQTLILRKHRLTHTRTQDQTHTWVSMVGGETGEGGGSVDGGPWVFISRGMLPVSKGTHFMHSSKQLGTPKTPRGLPNSILAPCLLLHTQFSFSSQTLLHLFTFSFFFISMFCFVFPLSSYLHLLYLNHSPSVCPSLPPSVSRPISGSPGCFLTAKQSIFQQTRLYQNGEVLLWWMGVFLRSGSASVSEVTYSDKAPVGDVCVCVYACMRAGEGCFCHCSVTIGPDTWGMEGGLQGGRVYNLSKGPASFNKASFIPHLKRPSFLLLSPPHSFSWLNAGKSTSLPKPRREINAKEKEGKKGDWLKKKKKKKSLYTTQWHWTVTWAKAAHGMLVLSPELSLDSDESFAVRLQSGH